MSEFNRAEAPESVTEGSAVLETIDALPPSAPTACAGWTAHDIVAHLAAGAKEIADLIERSLAGDPERPTRGFEEREAPMRALSHDELRRRLVAENVRKLAAWDALAERTADPAIAFTGTRVSVDEFRTHSRSEAAIHRWDMVGDDDLASEMLAQPDLTAHAIKVLNRMPILNESARSLSARAPAVGVPPVRIVFRCTDQPDVVFVASMEGGRLEIPDQAVLGDVTLTTDPANRLLVLWGRKSSDRPIAVDGDPAMIETLDAVLWPNAQRWPSPGTAPTA